MSRKQMNVVLPRDIAEKFETLSDDPNGTRLLAAILLAIECEGSESWDKKLEEARDIRKGNRAEAFAKWRQS